MNSASYVSFILRPSQTIDSLTTLAAQRLGFDGNVVDSHMALFVVQCRSFAGELGSSGSQRAIRLYIRNSW
jgi:hypothetical protein